MPSFIQKFFESVGLKRKISTYLTAVTALMVQYPELQIALPLLQYIAAFFGITGVVHGVKGENIPKFKLASIVSLLSVLIVAAAKIPALNQYSLLLHQIALIIAPFASGYALANAETKK